MWTYPLAELEISEYWGTGDLMVSTRTAGSDTDPNGYGVIVRRSDPGAEPEWSAIHDLQMSSHADQVWRGGNCRQLNPLFFDPAGILDCDLVATRHEIEIDGIMWNCALQGESARLRCIEAGERLAETFDVVCVSAYASLMGEVADALNSGLVRNQGIAQSIIAKLENAEARRDSGQYNAAMNNLRALDHFLQKSAGQQVDAAFAQHLSTRVREVMELFVWPSPIGSSRHAER